MQLVTGKSTLSILISVFLWSSENGKLYYTVYYLEAIQVIEENLIGNEKSMFF